MAIQSEGLSYTDGELALSGFLAWDDALPSPTPGVLVVHGGGGLDDHARAQARRVAELGVVALALDMFGPGVKGDRTKVMATIQGLRGDRAKLVGRVQAGLQALRQQARCAGPIAAVGYCFGGMTVLELARSGEVLAGVASIHGSLETTQRAAPGTVSARVLVCHGALDPHVPLTQVQGFLEEMNAAGADYQLAVYGGAVHGFTHAGAPSTMPGVGFHAPTDRRSWQLLSSFLQECLALPG